ncbi:MAG: hypothetical protein ABI183_18110 [Polyangiaceae bacterium]
MRQRSFKRIGLPFILVIATCGGVIASCSSGDDAASPTNDASTGDSTTTDSGGSDSAFLDRVAPEPDLIKVSAGAEFTCITDTSQKVKCWGTGAYGELGFAPDASSNPPAANGVSAVFLAAGWYHACASDGTIADSVCWGYNHDGELARNDLSASAIGPLGGFSGSPSDTIKALSSGRSHSCAIVGTSVQCWGSPEFGDLGFDPDGSVASTVPSVIALPGPADQLSVGVQSACARLASDGSVWCWGSNNMGELGMPYQDGGGFSSAPVRVGAFSGVLQIALGAGQACAVLSDHTVTCWGRNAGSGDHSLGGALGHDPTTDEECLYGKCDPTPTAVAGLTDVAQVSIGSGQTCALKTDHTVLCWGDNLHGKLGHDPATDTFVDASSGSSLYDFTPTLVAGLSNVVEIAAGISHTCAATADNRVFCWGSNLYGQLGVPDAASVNFVPQEVLGL